MATKKQIAKNMIDEAKLYKSQLASWYKYNSQLSREANLSAQEKRTADLKNKIKNIATNLKPIIEQIMIEEKAKPLEPIKPTWNAYEQLNSFKK